MTSPRARKLIDKYLKKWQRIVEVFGWRVEVIFLESGHDMPAGHGDSYACTHFQFRYLEGTIKFNLRMCQDLTAEGIEEVVVHELAHLLLAAVSEDNCEQNVEYSTTAVSRMLLLVNR